MPGGGEAEQSSSSVFRAREVQPYLLCHLQHRLISMIQTRQKSGRNLSRHYSVATKLHQEPETVQTTTLLTVIGAEARKVFSMFTFGDDKYDRIQPVSESFAAYC